MKTLLLLLISTFVFAQSSDNYYNKAIESLDKGNYSDANIQIDKAILLDNENLEYRWIKSRVNLTSNSDRKNLEIAIENLKFILSKGGESSKIYNAIGIAERQLGYDIKNFDQPSKDNSFRDNNKVNEEWKIIYEKALQHLIAASEYFSKAEDIKKGSAKNAHVYLKEDIEDLKQKIK